VIGATVKGSTVDTCKRQRRLATADGQTETYTRPEVTWHVLEHDLHHGGEIGYSFGMQGLAAPDI
jgi:uncharacterized damage-inducible protein DinB